MEYCEWILENGIFRKWWEYLLLAATVGILLFGIKESLLSGREQTRFDVEETVQGQNFVMSISGNMMLSRLTPSAIVPDRLVEIPGISAENPNILVRETDVTVEMDTAVFEPDICKEIEIAEGIMETPSFLPDLTEPEKNAGGKEKEYSNGNEYPEAKGNPDGVAYPEENLDSVVYPDGKEELSGETASDGEKHTWLSSGFEVNEEGLIVDYWPTSDETAGFLELPDIGCTGIAKGAFTRAGAGICELYIPSNITRIEAGGLSGLPDLEWICVEPENAYFQSREGILYDREMTAVLAFPAGRIGVYVVPPEIVRFASWAFEGTRLQKIDMRECCGAMKIENRVFGENGVDGLVILAPAGCQEVYRERFAETGAIVK